MPKEERFSIACAQRQERRTVLLETFEGVAEEWLRLQSKTLAPETTSILRSRLKSLTSHQVRERPKAGAALRLTVPSWFQ